MGSCHPFVGQPNRSPEGAGEADGRPHVRHRVALVGIVLRLSGYPRGMTPPPSWSSRSAYDPEGQVNVRGFAGSLAAYMIAAATLSATARSSGRLTENYSVVDLIVGGIATHKFSRLLSKGAVTSPLRAPFTEFESAIGSSEHMERVRGEHGLRHTVGELITCPFCLDVWVATAYVGGLTLAPRATRAWAAVFATTGASDFLQQVYSRLRDD